MGIAGLAVPGGGGCWCDGWLGFCLTGLGGAILQVIRVYIYRNIIIIRTLSYYQKLF